VIEWVLTYLEKKKWHIIHMHVRISLPNVPLAFMSFVALGIDAEAIRPIYRCAFAAIASAFSIPR
jgi:hypothetical protein